MKSKIKAARAPETEFRGRGDGEAAGGGAPGVEDEVLHDVGLGDHEVEHEGALPGLRDLVGHRLECRGQAPMGWAPDPPTEPTGKG